MSLRVLLVNPPVFAVNEPWYDTPAFGRAGLAYVAGFLRGGSDHAVEILDSKLERLDFNASMARIQEFRPDVVGLTAFTNEIKPAAEMARRIKAALPTAVTVIGGVHVTALPRETLAEFPIFDYGVDGEGEITFLELCNALHDGSAVPGIPGVVYRRDGTVETAGSRERILDLDSIPFPAWDLLPPASTYYVQTQRGCPFACKFCMNPNGKFARRRSVQNVIEELQQIIKAYGPQTIWYGDEIFTVDVEHTKKFLRAKIEAGIPAHVDWGATTHVRFVDDELFGLMRESNVQLVGFGIETGDEETLKRIGKGTTVEMMLRARAGARKAGVPITTYFILGQPDETVRSIRASINLGVRLNPELPIFGIMVPYPGTEVARMAARGERGYRLLTKDWDDYNKQIGGALEFANLSRPQIEMLQLWAYVKVFLWNFRLFDLARFVWEYRTAGWSIVRRIVSGVFRRDSGKDETRVDRGVVHADVIAKATERWHTWQVAELVRAKKSVPHERVEYRDKLKPGGPRR